MAFVLAKETFTRRFTCVSLCIVDTQHVVVSPMAEAAQNAYDLISEAPSNPGDEESYEIYHLLKRGKQHIHITTVTAGSPQQAMLRSREQAGDASVLNIWAVRTADIRFTTPEESDLWLTLPEKKFRDAAAYKGGDKLKALLDRLQS